MFCHSFSLWSGFAVIPCLLLWVLPRVGKLKAGIVLGQIMYSVDKSRPAVVSSSEPSGSKEDSQHTNLNVVIFHRVVYSEPVTEVWGDLIDEYQDIFSHEEGDLDRTNETHH